MLQAPWQKATSSAKLLAFLQNVLEDREGKATNLFPSTYISISLTITTSQMCLQRPGSNLLPLLLYTRITSLRQHLHPHTPKKYFCHEGLYSEFTLPREQQRIASNNCLLPLKYILVKKTENLRFKLKVRLKGGVTNM